MKKFCFEIGILIFSVAVVTGQLHAQGTTVHSGAAASVNGVVVVSGSAANIQTKLADSAGGTPHTVLCRSGEAKKIGRVTGMTVLVTGLWGANPLTKEKCLETKSFKVLKAPSGREAVVGKLIKQDANFYVLTGDGKRRELSSVPAGLAKLEGKEVVIDVKPLDSPVGSEAAGKSSRVVSYSEHP